MDFGLRELRLAAQLLSLLKTSQDHTLRLGDKVTPEFNTDSGAVFLIDDSFHVAMLNKDRLEDWLVCPSCGSEGFKDTLAHSLSPCCNKYAKTEFFEK
jgi:predicted lactoylglutathione lyase